MSKNNTVRFICFTVILAISFFSLQELFSVGQNRAYQNERGFYKEKRDSLDAVYIGASNVHAFWQPPLAWKDYGIAVWSFSVDSMPLGALKNMIIEAHKTQPNAVIIINVNAFKDIAVTDVEIHRLVDYLPTSLNKARLINKLAEESDIAYYDRLEFFLPIIRFHSRWSEFESWDFVHHVNGYKSGIIYKPFIQYVEDLSSHYLITEEKEKPTTTQMAVLNDILNHIKQKDIRALFVTVPQAMSEEQLSQINAIEDLIREKGYGVLDILEEVDELHIHTDTDFYNKNHTNVHGSIKYTDYLAKYLVENYGFKDKRGMPGWESWDEGAVLYENYISPWTLPFEREHAPRDYELISPNLIQPTVSGQSVLVSWEESPGAEGYVIFRKASAGNKSWTEIAEVPVNEHFYSDAGLKGKTTYTYTVVPIRYKSECRLYGRFNYLGVSAETEA